MTKKPTAKKKPTRKRKAAESPAQDDRTTMAGNSRIQVPANDQQKAVLKAAADKAGYANARATGGLGQYIHDRALTIAKAELAGEVALVLGPNVAAIVRREAAKENCTPEEAITRGLGMLGAVRASNSANG